jgi:magnesium transporter
VSAPNGEGDDARAPTRWIDLVDPTADDLLAAAPGLDPEMVALLTAPAGDGRDVRPRLESRGPVVAGLFLLPVHLEGLDRFSYLELGLVASADHLVTVRKSDPAGRLTDVGRAVPTRPEVSVGSLIHGVIDDVTESYLDLVDALYLEIDELEDHIDELPGADTRRRLADLRHEMLHARKGVTATRAAVRRVIDGRIDLDGDRLFPREVELAFADTYDTLVRTTEELDVARDLLASVRDYLQSKISENQNEVVKTLTVIASLVLVPTLITGFYGQNFEGVFHRPLWTLTTSVALIVSTTLLQLALFRWKRWI